MRRCLEREMRGGAGAVFAAFPGVAQAVVLCRPSSVCNTFACIAKMIMFFPCAVPDAVLFESWVVKSGEVTAAPAEVSVSWQPLQVQSHSHSHFRRVSQRDFTIIHPGNFFCSNHSSTV